MRNPNPGKANAPMGRGVEAIQQNYIKPANDSNVRRIEQARDDATAYAQVLKILTKRGKRPAVCRRQIAPLVRNYFASVKSMLGA